MKVKVQNQDEEQKEIIDEKPQEEIQAVDEVVDEKHEDEVIEEQKPDATESLKLELAELRGQISVLKDQKREQPLDPKEQQALQTKTRVMADVNSLDDDQFQDLYKMSKLQAVNSVNQYEREQESSKHSQKIAELEAKNELIAKYPSFAKHYDKVKVAIADLSPEVRQDPERLKRALEKEFLYVAKDEKTPAPAKKETDMQRRRIVNDFEKPNLNPSRGERKDEDLIAPEDRELAAHFGLHKESDRKKFSSPYIPMDLGTDRKDGKRVVFEDPKRGFVKVGNS